MLHQPLSRYSYFKFVMFYIRPTPLRRFPVLDFELFRTALPPVYFAATSHISKGIKGGRIDTPMPFGTLILTVALPAPVTATHPRPVKVISAAASFHPAPSISMTCDTNSPSSSIRSGPGSNGGVNIPPA